MGKEVILNISTLRWANQVFEPTWNREYIESVQIVFKEDIGLGGRGGYFDTFGIIRDMMQNQLLQIMLWIGMDPPEDMSAAKIREAKVELLRCIETLHFDANDCFLGQFGPSEAHPGYLDDETVPKDSRCPTFASLLLQVNNTRWRGVPFLMTAGKGMDERVCEVRLRYKEQPHNELIAAMNDGHGLPSNELVMRIGPGEALFMTTTSKVPGLKWKPKSTVMDMSYDKQFKGTYVGDAYERLLLNAALGDRSLFVSADELVEMWRIFTPLLHQIDEQNPEVALHPFGVLPTGWAEWAAAKGVTPTEFREKLSPPPMRTPQTPRSPPAAQPLDIGDGVRAGTAPHTSQRKHSGALWLRCSVLLVHLLPKFSFLRALGDGEAAPLLVALWGGSAGLTEARVRFLPGVTDCSRCRLRVTCACVRACVCVGTDSRPNMVLGMFRHMPNSGHRAIKNR